MTAPTPLKAAEKSDVATSAISTTSNLGYFSKALLSRGIFRPRAALRISLEGFPSDGRKQYVPSDRVASFKKLIHDFEAEVSSSTSDLMAKMREIKMHETPYSRIQGVWIQWTYSLKAELDWFGIRQ
jgi:hypothetical protein